MMDCPVKKIMFFCYGSIHAERKIQMFINDPRFEVTVVSNFSYNFPNTRIIRLSKKLLQMSSHSFVIKKDFLYPLRLLFLLLQIFIALLQEVIITLRDAFTIHWAFRKYKPDLVYYQTLLYPCFVALFVNRKIPFLVTFWNGDLTWFSKNTGIERILKKYIIKKGVIESQIITINSKSLEDECLNYKIKRDKIKYVFDSGVDLSLFRPIDKKLAKDKIGFQNQHIILCPRGIGVFYNSISVIKAAKEVLSVVPDALFLFLIDVSSHNIWKEYQELIRKLNLPEESFKAIDKQPSDDMPYYYSAADIMVSLSSYDSKCYSMIEAFACGTVALMTDLPQIRETITDGVNGYVVDPLNITDISDKIIRLFIDNEIRQSFIDFNFKLVKDVFDSEIVSCKMKDIILSNF